MSFLQKDWKWEKMKGEGSVQTQVKYSLFPLSFKNVWSFIFHMIQSFSGQRDTGFDQSEQWTSVYFRPPVLLFLPLEWVGSQMPLTSTLALLLTNSLLPVNNFQSNQWKVSNYSDHFTLPGKPSCHLCGLLCVYMPHPWWIRRLEVHLVISGFSFTLLIPIDLGLVAFPEGIILWSRNLCNCCAHWRPWISAWCSRHHMVHVLPLLLGPSCRQHPDGSTWMCKDAGQGQPAPLVWLLILGDGVVTKQPRETDTQRPRILTKSNSSPPTFHSAESTLLPTRNPWPLYSGCNQGLNTLGNRCASPTVVLENVRTIIELCRDTVAQKRKWLFLFKELG